MTSKQTDRIRDKIGMIRKTLAAEKKKFGYYDDSRGIRYLPPQYYIRIADYEEGMKYGNWFDKNFPDDTGFPDFLFERAIIFFKTGKYKEAERALLKTFFSNTYLFDKFFGRPIVPIEKWEGSNIAGREYADTLIYKSDQPDLSDFSDWLDGYMSTDLFLKLANEYIDISKRLMTEKDTEIRHYLISRVRELEGAQRIA